MSNRIQVEIDVTSLEKLLVNCQLGVQNFSCVDKAGKRYLQELFLLQVKQQAKLQVMQTQS